MRRKENEHAGIARTGLWAVSIVAAGALLAGLGGWALAGALPAAGGAEALPVYTSLNLVAEDEPVPAIWQRYDPDEMLDRAAAAAQPGMPLADPPAPDTDAFWAEERLCLSGMLYDPSQGQAVELPWQTPASNPGSAWYLYQYELPGTLRLIDQVTGALHDPGRVLADLAIGSGSAARYYFPDLPPAEPAQFDEARELVQQRLLELLRGDNNLLLGIPFYEVSNGMTTWMDARAWVAEIIPADAAPTEQLQQISDALWMDLQTIQLDNELLVVLGERGSGGMICLYYDVRLRCVTGLVVEY